MQIHLSEILIVLLVFFIHFQEKSNIIETNGQFLLQRHVISLVKMAEGALVQINVPVPTATVAKCVRKVMKIFLQCHLNDA